MSVQSAPFTPDVLANRMRELLNYDPQTGVFVWRVGRGNQMVGIGSIAGSPNKAGYIQIKIDGRLYRRSRLAWLYMTGSWPAYHIDHRDRNRSNDAWDNLRVATHQQNCRNRKNYRPTHDLPRGVYHNSSRYAARIKVGKRLKHLGTFDTAEDAHKAYVTAAKNLHGEYLAGSDHE